MSGEETERKGGIGTIGAASQHGSGIEIVVGGESVIGTLIECGMNVPAIGGQGPGQGGIEQSLFATFDFDAGAAGPRRSG